MIKGEIYRKIFNRAIDLSSFLKKHMGLLVGCSLFIIAYVTFIRNKKSAKPTLFKGVSTLENK